MKTSNRILLFSIVIIISTIQVSAQVKIGDNESTIDAASLLELESTTKGLLTPRMTTAQRDAISNPPKSLVIFNTTLNCLQSNIGDADTPNWECIGLGDADTDSVAVVDGTLNYYRGGNIVAQYPITGVGGGTDVKVSNFAPNNAGDSLILTMSDGTMFKTPNVSTTCAAAIGSGTQKYIAINTWTSINLNAESYDNTNSLNTSTNKFVVPADGIYQVSSTIQVYTTSHPKTMYFGIGKNGAVTGIYENEVTTAGYNYVRKNVSGTLELKAGDEITPMAYSNIAAYATNLFFSISRLDCGEGAAKDTVFVATEECYYAEIGTSSSYSPKTVSASPAFTSTEYDEVRVVNGPSSMADIANNRIVIPADGDYTISSYILGLSSGRSNPEIEVMVNGVRAFNSNPPVGETGTTEAADNYIRFMQTLEQGDLITANFRNSAGGTITAAILSVERLDCGGSAMEKDTVYVAGDTCIYGSSALGSILNINTVSPSWKNTNLTMTLPEAGTYRVMANVYGDFRTTTNSAVNLNARLYDVTNSAVVGGQWVVVGADDMVRNRGASAYHAFLTVAGPTVIRLEGHRTANTTDKSDFKGETFISYERIDCGGSAGGNANNGVTNFAPNSAGDSLVLTLSDGTVYKTPNVSTSCAAAIATGLGTGMSANTWTYLDMSSESYDNTNSFDVSNDQFVAPAAGIYQVNATMEIYTTSHPITGYFGITQNGSVKVHVNEVSSAGYNYIRKNVAGILVLEAGDIIKAQAHSTVGTTGKVIHFSLSRIDCGGGSTSTTTSSDTLYPTPISIITVNSNTTSTNANYDLNTLSGVTVPTGAKYAIIRARGYWAHSGASATNSTGHAHVKLSNDGTNYNTVAYAAGNAGTGREDTDSDFNDVKVRLRDGKIGYQITVSGTATLRFGSISLLGFE